MANDIPRKPPAKKNPGPAARRAAPKSPHDDIAEVVSIRRPRTSKRKMDSSTSPEQIALAERRSRALNLRRAALTFQQIVDRLQIAAAAGQIAPLPPSYDKSACRKDVLYLMDEMTVRPALERLAEELDLLQGMQTILYSKIMTGGKEAVSATLAMLRLMDRRARYIGLDAPVRLTGPDGGPIQVTPVMSDPAALAAAAKERLDSILPRDEPPAIEGTIVG